jgi:hypothetical protein
VEPKKIFFIPHVKPFLKRLIKIFPDPLGHWVGRIYTEAAGQEMATGSSDMDAGICLSREGSSLIKVSKTILYTK